jgi:A/G-specific adenine glycosylase
VLEKDGSVFLRMRKSEGIWEGMWEFPVVESADGETPPDPMELLGRSGFAVKGPTLRETREFRHQLTHQTIFAKFWVFQANSSIIVNENEFEFVAMEHVNTYPIHRLMLKFIHASDLFKTTGP